MISPRSFQSLASAAFAMQPELAVSPPQVSASPCVASSRSSVCGFSSSPYLDSGALEPVLEPRWQRFSGPFLYYPGRRHLPAPLRVLVDFLKVIDSSNTPPL